MSTLANSGPLPLAARHTAVAERADSIPWYAWCAALALLSAVIGGHWDISWHMSIGRDTFWTPAHMAIYACGLLAGLVSGYLILGATFGRLPEIAAASISVFGFRGPLGAFLMGWGGMAMLTSAPFDDWWHSAYGLDVKILSPPHVVLMIGVFAIGFGSLLLLLGLRNRASGEQLVRYDWLFLIVAGLLMTMIQIAFLEYTLLPFQHTARCYIVLASTVPLYFWLAAQVSPNRWACTIVAGVYMVMLLAMLWILPRFPAEPKLGPVFYPVTHFVPAAGFPLLLIAPALAIDLVRQRFAITGTWRQAIVYGLLFVAVLLAVQWPFASFLQSPAARNAIFGSDYYPYYAGPQSYFIRHVFHVAENEAAPRQFALNLGYAFVAGVLITWLGLKRGAWMSRVQR